jgi:Mn2+/Fe2+ NRAMP family transporter
MNDTGVITAPVTIDEPNICDTPLRKGIPATLAQGLPAVSIRDMPVPKPFWAVLGPGVIMVATALGSGEIYFWPGITMTYGFGFLWLALIALFLQYVLNTEFARYTLATGETIITGFSRLWQPFAWLFLLCSTLPWLWPGWSTGGATALSWVTGGRPEVISAISLVLIGVTLTGTRIVYKAVEFIQMVLTAFIIVVVAGVAVVVVQAPTLAAFADGLMSIPTSLPEGLKIATLLSALAFCGAGGSVNLATSHWMRDKGFGMGALVPKVTSPLTGENISVASEGYFFEPTEQNITRWQAWWRLARREQTITFLITGAAGLVLLMLVAHSLLFGSGIEMNMGALMTEGNKLADRTIPWAAPVFYLMVAAVFFTSALGILDHVARLAADILKTNSATMRCSNNPLLSESALYFYVLWLMIAFAIAVLFVANLQDPSTLLKISGSLSGIVMFLYSVLVIVLMLKLCRETELADPRFKTCNPFRVSAWRKMSLAAAVLLYGGFSILLIMDTVKSIAL